MAVDFDITRVSLIRLLHLTAQELCQSLGICPSTPCLYTVVDLDVKTFITDSVTLSQSSGTV